MYIAQFICKCHLLVVKKQRLIYDCVAWGRALIQNKAVLFIRVFYLLFGGVRRGGNSANFLTMVREGTRCKETPTAHAQHLYHRLGGTRKNTQ